MIRLEYEIRNSGMTQKQVAEHAQVGYWTLNHILNGKQKVGTTRGHVAERLALAVGWPVDRKEELFEEIHLQETR